MKFCVLFLLGNVTFGGVHHKIVEKMVPLARKHGWGTPPDQPR